MADSPNRMPGGRTAPGGDLPTYKTVQRQTTWYAYNPHLDLELIWAVNAEHISFEVILILLQDSLADVDQGDSGDRTTAGSGPTEPFR